MLEYCAKSLQYFKIQSTADQLDYNYLKFSDISNLHTSLSQ